MRRCVKAFAAVVVGSAAIGGYSPPLPPQTTTESQSAAVSFTF
jgi:hypothetical protein